MKKSNKVLGWVLAVMFSFSQPAFSLIIEGTFSGTTEQFLNADMHVTPEAEFWHENENEFNTFTGSFWYDTELGGPGISPWNPDVVMYIQEFDWVHTTLVGANGASVEITSRGGLPRFSEHPTDSIYISRRGDGDTFDHKFTMVYSDYAPPTEYREEGPHRDGALTIRANAPLLDGFGLAQNFEFSSEQNGNKPVGSVYLKTKGAVEGISYQGEFRGDVNKFEIHVREPVSVPEPSSLFLFLLPLIFLLWRADLLFPRSQA